MPQPFLPSRRRTSRREEKAQASPAESLEFIWLNDDDDNADSAADANDAVVNGAKDLEDFFPVFLDIQQLVKVLPPSASVKYKLKQADGAVNFVETNLPRASAFSYQSGALTTGFGAALGQAAASAATTRVTAAGVELSAQFLNNVRDNNQGVILVEGRTPSTAPLVLTVEKDGAQVAEVSLPLSLGARILLLLHGMNSNTDTWNAYVTASFGGSSATIRDGAIISPTPTPTTFGVRCYRLQFGFYDMASTRVGLEDVRPTNSPGYANYPVRCGDFETFAELGQEIDDAVTTLLVTHPNAQIVLLGHSRGGLAARAFLQTPGSTPTKAAVIGLLTTSSPHLGSRMGRIYGWLNTHRRNQPGTDSDDWDVVDFLRSPTVPVIGTAKDAIDVRRPIILDVADNSLAIAGPAGLNAGVGNLPAGIRYGEIVYDRARFGLMTLTPVRYTVFDGPGGNPFDQLSDAATTFLCNGGTPDDLQFRGDGLIPAGNQRFTQLSGFTGTAIDFLTVTTREVVHTGAPNQTGDLLAQLRILYPDWWPSP